MSSGLIPEDRELARTVVSYVGDPSPSASQALEDLRQSVIRRGYRCELSNVPGPTGAKGPTADFVIAATTMGLTGVSTLISVFAMWQARNRRYGITLKVGEVRVSVDDLTESELRRCTEQFGEDGLDELLIEVAQAADE